jgi:hypothetical protein
MVNGYHTRHHITPHSNSLNVKISFYQRYEFFNFACKRLKHATGLWAPAGVGTNWACAPPPEIEKFKTKDMRGM